MLIAKCDACASDLRSYRGFRGRGEEEKKRKVGFIAHVVY